MSEETNTQLPVLQNRAPAEMVVAQQMNALSRLFQLKPKSIELVSKSTRQEGAEPGTFRVITTNEKFKELRAVMLYLPTEQREMYKKGDYNKDAKLCFSLDNVQPHQKAKNPPALYCSTCPMGDINWTKYRDAAARGVSGDALTALLPPCRKYWHLFLAARDTLVPYYFNVKGTSVKPFEQAMQNVSELFLKINQMEIAENKALVAKGEKALPITTNPAELIWRISFTMYSWQKNGGPFMLGLKDFRVMSAEDRASFGKLIQDYAARRAQGAIQTQEAAEAEAEAAVVEGAKNIPVADATVVDEVAEANAKIVI